MSESNHTPGPWGFGRTSDDQRMILGDGGEGKYVCHVQIHQTPRYMGTLDEPEREANARLIARAPDLLREVEELKAQNAELLEAGERLAFVVGNVLDQMARDGRVDLLDIMPNGDADVAAIHFSARTVIAKAKGGAA